MLQVIILGLCLLLINCGSTGSGTRSKLSNCTRDTEVFDSCLRKYSSSDIGCNNDQRADDFFHAITSSCGSHILKPLVLDIGVNKGFTLLRYFFTWGNLQDHIVNDGLVQKKLISKPRLPKKSSLRVFAFDPLPGSQTAVSLLETNLPSLKQYLTFVPIAVSNYTGSSKFTVPYETLLDEGGQLGTMRAGTRSRTFVVQVDKLDSWLPKQGITISDEVSFMKIDCEGLDFDVLLGANDLFQRRGILAGYFECGDITPIDTAVAFLSEHGYSSYLLQDKDRSLRRLDDGFSDLSKFRCSLHMVAFVRKDLACTTYALHSYMGHTISNKCFSSFCAQ